MSSPRLSIAPKFGPLQLSTITFLNDTGTVPVLVVTGDVQIEIIPICKTNVASVAGANIELGVSADVNAIISSTLSTDIAVNDIWFDASPDSSIEAASGIRDYIVSNGDDVIMTLSDQVDSGVIAFYFGWRPLSAGATVVAA